MREIKQLQDGDWEEAIRLQAEAYPGVGIVTAEDRERAKQNIVELAKMPNVHHYGLFEGEQLLGMLRMYDFQMRLLSAQALTGGVGSVAVDLRHKKEKVARDLLLFFLRYYRQQGACMATLYPFRPDFYKQMGFGFGAKLNQYDIDPKTLPNGRSKNHLVTLSHQDLRSLYDCYQRYWQRTNGLFQRTWHEWETHLSRKGWHFLGYQEDGQILGYLAYSFVPGQAGHFLNNDLVIHEWIYETPPAFLELATFLHSQADQFERLLYTTYDDSFHFVLTDPRNRSGKLLSPPAHESNVQAVGIMYRVIDVPRLFEVLAKHNFGGQSCRLQITVQDSFLPENEGSTVVWFENGRSHLPHSQEYDIAISLNIADFSALVTGAISFAQLYSYGQAQISDAAFVEKVNQLFFTAQKPISLSRF